MYLVILCVVIRLRALQNSDYLDLISDQHHDPPTTIISVPLLNLTFGTLPKDRWRQTMWPHKCHPLLYPPSINQDGVLEKYWRSRIGIVVFYLILLWDVSSEDIGIEAGLEETCDLVHPLRHLQHLTLTGLSSSDGFLQGLQPLLGLKQKQLNDSWSHVRLTFKADLQSWPSFRADLHTRGRSLPEIISP